MIFKLSPADLITIRRQLGLSQSGLAAQIGVNKSEIGALETGRRGITRWHRYIYTRLQADVPPTDDEKRVSPAID